MGRVGRNRPSNSLKDRLIRAESSIEFQTEEIGDLQAKITKLKSAVEIFAVTHCDEDVRPKGCECIGCRARKVLRDL